MRLEDYLTAKGIKYQSEVFDGSKVVKIGNSIRIHIYKEQVLLCVNDRFMAFPPKTESFEKIKEIIDSEYKGN